MEIQGYPGSNRVLLKHAYGNEGFYDTLALSYNETVSPDTACITFRNFTFKERHIRVGGEKAFSHPIPVPSASLSG